MAQAEKLRQARELQAALDQLQNLHRQEFAEATAPQAPALPAINATAVLSRHEERALAGIGPFQLAARKRARANARVAAQEEIEQLRIEQEHLQRLRQRELDRWWESLLRNDPQVVLGALADAFEDNEAPAAAVGVEGGEVSLITLVPGVEVVPERKPARTPAGNVTLKKLSKAERGALHTTVVCGYVLITVREALAVAPGLSAARVLAVRHQGLDLYGKPRLEPVLAALFERQRLDGVQWDRVDSIEVVVGASTELLMNPRKTSHELQPLDLRGEPALAAVLQRLEVDDWMPRS